MGEKERSSSHEVQLRDASEEIKQQNDTSTATRFPFPRAEICQQARSIFKKFESSLDQADLTVSQRRTELQQVTRKSNDLWKKKDGKHILISDLQRKINAQAPKKKGMNMPF